MVSPSTPASASVFSISVNFLRGKAVESVKAVPAGQNVATCCCSWSTVCVWFALTSFRVPSASFICSVVVGCPASTTSSAATADVAVDGAESSRIVCPSPSKGLGGGGTYSSLLLSMMCTSPSGLPSAPMSSAGICPWLTAARKAALSGSCALRSGPSSTLKPLDQKVMVCSCAGAARGSPTALWPSSDWPVPAKEEVPAAGLAALCASALTAPISSRARFMNSRGSRISCPLPPPAAVLPPA
mmetsp:Transcript_3690/g.8335  ORF Transcript_3690/g.8335 Transcript_3690/m.8335 type:complete len:243 (+) Transcript_3690:169-897(+)